MHVWVSRALSALFVLLGGLNVWLMLASRRTGQITIRVHRTAGYLFVSIYALMFCYMGLRLKDVADELTPQLVVHISLALLLLPLLLAKILVARYQKSLSGVLRALGIAIFAISFTLVALNLVPLLGRHIPARTFSRPVALALVVGVVAIFGTLLARRPTSSAAGVGETGITNSTTHLPGNRKPGSISLTLVRAQPQTHDSKTLRFLVPREQRFDARPGQFLNFNFVIEGKSMVRSYSLCSSPTQSGYIEITPKRMPNGQVSAFLNDQALPGLTIQADGPHGNFCFDEKKDKRIVLIAGGSGITPMMSMLRYIDDLCLTTEITLIYCVRTEEDVIFEADLIELGSRFSSFRYVLVLSQPGATWQGARGHLTREILEAEIQDPKTSTFFLCGPPPMMQTARDLLGNIGVDSANIRQESFGSQGRRADVPAAAIQEFAIRFTRSQKISEVSPSQTVLEAAEANGICIPFGCRQGECGSCTTKLLAGKVEMERQDGLTAELKEEGYILPCVSHARSDITLDA